MENVYTPTYEENFLQDAGYSLIRADSGKRFANWLIDIITFYVLVFLGSLGYLMLTHDVDSLGGGSGLGSAGGLSSAGSLGSNSGLGGSTGSGFGLKVLSLIMFVFFNALVEGFTRGKSLGKFITGTRAVNQDGSRIGGFTAFVRSLFRAIPFEPLSALGSPAFPWHDKWSDTYVIDEKLSRLPDA